MRKLCSAWQQLSLLTLQSFKHTSSFGPLLSTGNSFVSLAVGKKGTLFANRVGNQRHRLVPLKGEGWFMFEMWEACKHLYCGIQRFPPFLHLLLSHFSVSRHTPLGHGECLRQYCEAHGILLVHIRS